MAQLTAGAVNAMNNNNTGIKPTLQLIDVKKIQPANPHAMASDRYRLVISDGTQLMQAMLATNLNSMMDSGQVRQRPIAPPPPPSDQPPPLTPPLPKSHAVGPLATQSTHCARWVLRWQLQKFSIVRLDEFICNTVQNRRIIIVLNLTAIQACNEQIGNPVRIDDGAPGAAGGAPAAPGRHARRARRACRLPPLAFWHARCPSQPAAPAAPPVRRVIPPALPHPQQVARRSSTRTRTRTSSSSR